MSNTAKVATLRKRKDYLEARITDHFGVDSRATEEWRALSWAIPILEDLVARRVEQANDVHQVQREASFAWLAQLGIQQLAERDLHAAADLLAQVADDRVRKGVLRSIERHTSDAGLGPKLRMLVSEAKGYGQ